MAAEITALIDPKTLESFAEQREAIAKVMESAQPLAVEVPIADHEEAGRVADAVRELSMALSDLDKVRLAEGAPYRATTDAINADYKELGSQSTAALAALKDRGLAFQKAEEARAKEEARIAAEKQQAEEAKAIADMQAAQELAQEEPDNSEAQELADEMRQEAAAAAAAPAPKPPPVPKQARGALGKLGSRKVYRFEVESEEKVPERYKVVSSDHIKAAVKAEAARVKANPGSAFNFELIPGVRIYTADVAVSR